MTLPEFADFFAGAGGLSLGLINAGLAVRYAFDADALACATHRQNIGGRVDCDSIEELEPKILGGDIGTPDVIVGGPPCQGFSTQRRGPAADQRNDLVLTYFRLALALRPRVIAMENVPGVLGRRGRVQMTMVYRELVKADYDVTSLIVDAATVGVPQRRRRALVVAWDPRRAKPFDPSPFLSRGGRLRTVRDAIGGMPSPPADFTDHPGYANHARVRMSALNIERISHVPPGGGRLDVPAHLQLPCHRRSGHRHLDVYGRLSWDQPAGTITAMFDNFTRGRFAHPAEDRNITNREGARLQSFPDDFVFVGPKKDVARQIGNAVPPRVGEVLGTQILAQLKH